MKKTRGSAGAVSGPNSLLRYHPARAIVAVLAVSLCACIPMMVSYYSPDPPTSTTTDTHCGWPNVYRKIDVAPGVSIELQTSPRDRIAFDAYIRISDASIVRFESDVIVIRSRELAEPLSLRIESIRRGANSIAVTSGFAGPDMLHAFVADPADKRRPTAISVELPKIWVNSEAHEIAPLTYRLMRRPSLVAPCM